MFNLHTLRTSSEILVLHVGTNDLSQKTAQNVFDELTTVGQAISVTDMPETKLMISAI